MSSRFVSFRIAYKVLLVRSKRGVLAPLSVHRYRYSLMSTPLNLSNLVVDVIIIMLNQQTEMPAAFAVSKDRTINTQLLIGSDVF